MAPGKPAKSMRTPSGAPSQKARDKTAALPGGRFPVFDKQSADAALKLRGRAGAPGSPAREKVINAAAKKDPQAAARARAADKKTRGK